MAEADRRAADAASVILRACREAASDGETMHDTLVRIRDFCMEKNIVYDEIFIDGLNEETLTSLTAKALSRMSLIKQKSYEYSSAYAHFGSALELIIKDVATDRVVRGIQTEQLTDADQITQLSILLGSLFRDMYSKASQSTALGSEAMLTDDIEQCAALATKAQGSYWAEFWFSFRMLREREPGAARTATRAAELTEARQALVHMTRQCADLETVLHRMQRLNQELLAERERLTRELDVSPGAPPRKASLPARREPEHDERLLYEYLRGEIAVLTASLETAQRQAQETEQAAAEQIAQLRKALDKTNRELGHLRKRRPEPQLQKMHPSKHR